MTVRNLLIVNAIFSALLALSELLAPGTVLSMAGLPVDDATAGVMQVLGGTTFGYTVTSWLMRDAGPSAARRAFLLGGGAGYAVVFVVLLIDIMTGVANWFGVASAVLTAVLGAGFLYLGLQSDAG